MKEVNYETAMKATCAIFVNWRPIGNRPGWRLVTVQVQERGPRSFGMTDVQTAAPMTEIGMWNVIKETGIRHVTALVNIKLAEMM